MNIVHLLQNTASQQKSVTYSVLITHSLAIEQALRNIITRQALYPNNWSLQCLALIKSFCQTLTQVNDTPNQIRREIASWQNHFLSDLIDLILSPIDLKKSVKQHLRHPIPLFWILVCTLDHIAF